MGCVKKATAAVLLYLQVVSTFPPNPRRQNVAGVLLRAVGIRSLMISIASPGCELHGLLIVAPSGEDIYSSTAAIVTVFF